MKFTVEADASKAVATLEVNGDTFKQEWKRVSFGSARATDIALFEQMEETGKYDDELIERICDEVDSNFIPLAFMQIAQEIEGDAE